MALIDVTALLSDPDFVDTATIYRRESTVNDYGENALTETAETAVMVVQPATPDDLQRLPDSVRMRAAIHVWYRGTLKTDAGDDVYPDVVEWQGRRYQVQTADDFGNYGAGYVEAICTLIEASV